MHSTNETRLKGVPGTIVVDGINEKPTTTYHVDKSNVGIPVPSAADRKVVEVVSIPIAINLGPGHII